MNDGPQQETVKKPKRRWGTLGQLSNLLWAIGLGFIYVPTVFGPEPAKGGLILSTVPLPLIIAGFTLIVLAAPTALLALKRRRKAEIMELVLAILGLVTSVMVICMLVRALLEPSGTI